MAAVVAADGPDGLTIPNVAARVQLTPPQRFGSKRALLIAFAKHQAEAASSPFDSVDAERTGPLDRLVAGLKANANQLGDKVSLAKNLALLHLDLTDPELGAHATTHSRGLLGAIKSLIEQAEAAGDLLDATDGDALATTIYTIYNGALVTWAIDGTGTIDDWLEERINEVIRPHIKPSRAAQSRGHHG